CCLKATVPRSQQHANRAIDALAVLTCARDQEIRFAVAIHIRGCGEVCDLPPGGVCMGCLEATIAVAEQDSQRSRAAVDVTGAHVGGQQIQSAVAIHVCDCQGDRDRPVRGVCLSCLEGPI